MTLIELPIIVNGKARYPSARDEVIDIKYESGIHVRIPRVTPRDLAEVKAAGPALARELQNLSTSDIAMYLNHVGNRWDKCELAGRRLANKYAPMLTEFSPVVIEGDYATMGHFMMQRFHIFDQIASEFGSEWIFDEWIPRQMSYVRAFPRGLALHYLVGNLPLASIYSLIRGIITKNRNFAKLPSRDPVTPIGFAQSIIEIDPEHPISRSLSLAYWTRDDPIGDEVIKLADTVCAWGGRAAVEAIKRRLPANVPLAEFGPRWSASAIDLDQCDHDKAAFRLIEDSAYYDQEACFNTQRAYVKGDIESFLASLRTYFDVFSKNVPLVSTSRDIFAHRSAALLESKYLGYRVEEGEDWTVIVLDADDYHTVSHPLTRTLFLHPVSDLDAIAKYFNNDSQTLSVYPWTLTNAHRDRWSAAGICRFVELGWSRIPRSGFTHDGMHGMHPLVRLVCIERPWSESGPYYGRRPNLEQYWFLDKYEQFRALIERRNAQEEETTS